MTDQLNHISQMIVSYTEQVERYESLSTWCALCSMLAILAVMMFNVSLILKGAGKCGYEGERYHLIVSGLFLTIPTITTLYLYIFAINMRKVALFRGYLSFLESQWNRMAGDDRMLFDLGIMDQFFSMETFPVNGLGPAVMILFLLLSLVLGFGLAGYFCNKLQKSSLKRGMRLLICIVGIVCVLFNGLCCYYLATNDSVVKAAFDYCENRASWND